MSSLRGFALRFGCQRDVRVETVRRATGRTGAFVRRVERIQGERKRRQLRLVDQRTRLQAVVRNRGIRKAFVLLHEHGAGESEVGRDGNADQHDEQRQMEQQVAGLAQMPLLGGDTGRRAVGAKSLASQQSCTPPSRPTSTSPAVVHVVKSGSRARLRGADGGRARIARKCRRLRGMTQPAREMNSKQINRGEPRRAENVEAADRVDERRKVRMLGVEVAHPQRVAAVLRQHAARNRGQCKQEQQDQCRAHRRQQVPSPPQLRPHRRDRHAAHPLPGAEIVALDRARYRVWWPPRCRRRRWRNRSCQTAGT